MPKISLSGVDVFSLVDADTPEAKAFLTYLGYLKALDHLIRSPWGDVDYPELLATMQASGRLHTMKGRRYRGPEEPVRALLLNAWVHEMHLHIVDTKDAGVVRLANHMAPVYAYYATTRSATAWLQVLNGSAPTTHAALLKQLSQLISNTTGLYPEPWSLRCTRVATAHEYRGFTAPPGPCSNLSRTADPLDVVGMALRTTRQRQVESLVEAKKRQLKRTRALSGEKQRCDAAIGETTVFDFLWRARTRSNYGDPAMFYMGALDESDVLAYHAALRNITAGTCFLFEAFIAQRAPDLLVDTAAHFMTRDRSRITDEVLGPRLTALGYTPRKTRQRGS